MREQPAVRTDADCTARPESGLAPMLTGTARVIIASTRAADGTYEDRTGPVLVQWLASRGLDAVTKHIVPDGSAVGEALAAAIAEEIDVIVTSGGTGISPTDATAEQTAPFIEREMPGVLEAVRRLGAEKTPTSLLSRGLAGMAGRSFVVNLPGSRGGVRDGIAVLDPILDHLLEQREGGGHGGTGSGAGGSSEDLRDHGSHGEAPMGGATRGRSRFAVDLGSLRIPEDPAMGSVAERIRYAEVTEEPVSIAAMAAAVADRRCGAVVTFDGVVRDHDGGRSVQALEYTAHPTAGAIIADVAREIAARYPDTLVAVVHRHGPLAIGDSALACAVAAPHRKQAFVACDDLVDTVKERVPIWKHQRFEDGQSEWVGALG